MNTILFFTISSTRGCSATLLRGAKEEAVRQEVHLQPVETEPTPDAIRDFTDVWHPLGAIVNCAWPWFDVDPGLFGTLPVSMVGHGAETLPPGIPNVMHDSREAGLEAARELLATGFRHAAYIGPGQSRYWSADRRDPFLRTMQMHGVSCQIMESDGANIDTKEGQTRLDATKVAHNVLIFLEKRREWCSVIEDAKARGELSMRPVHGDPKTANVMIDDMTNKGTAIIDLDTVKPGLVHTDIADCLRSCCNPAGEETHDISSVTFDTDLADAVLSGYREQAKGFLTEGEKEYLFDAVRLIAYEQALRFFADYIAGDVYYKVREDGQNLMRARVQVQLCRSIEANEPKIRRMLATL